ncbi:IclR family transcriptional regulator [Jiangella endophytica]|uniref:IclR family transcriptional regulator n=1 Tax=Jiangella endophytica TaxID=1623398 RepID=UPI000E3538A3|nr:IclR family transcriptional regulator [Jiangella endophytica]
MSADVVTGGGTRGAGKEKDPAPAAGRTLTVLETLVSHDDGLTLTELSKLTDIPLASCASIVYTLERRGYASRRVVGRSHFWRATLALYGLAVRLTRNVDLATVAQSEMQQLADDLGMPVHIGVLNGPSVVYVAKAAATGIIQFDTYPGKLSPFNLTALGRAIVAQYQPAELDDLLHLMADGRGPRAKGASKQDFLGVLEVVRADGYAVEYEEEEANVACVAAPFFGADGRVAGAVGVTAFAKDLASVRQQRVVGQRLIELASAISVKLGYSGSRARRD